VYEIKIRTVKVRFAGFRFDVWLDHIISRTVRFTFVVEKAEDIAFIEMPQWHPLSSSLVGVPLCAEVADYFA
jgi:hypothetical protein